MKKISTLLVALIATCSLGAQQFFNSDFESWNGNNPIGWNTINFMGQNLCSVAKSTDSHSGEAAIAVAPAMLPASIAAMLGSESFAIPGVLTNGTIDFMALMEFFSNMDLENTEAILSMLNSVIRDGFTVNQAPTSVSGYYKINEAEGAISTFMTLAVAFGEVNGERTPLGMGMFTNEEYMKTEGYAPFTMEMEYMEVNAEVNELVFVAVMGAEEFATTFSTLLLDDISIQYASGLEDLAFSANQISLYPNPTTGDFSLNAPIGSSISITNALGQTIKTIDAYNGEQISLSESGIYFVSIDNKAVRKLIVK